MVLHFCKDLLWGSNCNQGCGWCAESCRQLWGKPANSFGNPWYNWSWKIEHQSLLNYTFVYICNPEAGCWLADKHWRVGRVFSGVHIAVKVAVGVQKAADSCRGSPQTALALRTDICEPCRHRLELRIASSCFCDPWQLGGEAVCKKLRRTTVTSTCSSCRAGYAAPTCSFCRIEINTLASIFYCSWVNIFSTIFRPRLQFSPPCPYFLSRRSVSNWSQRHLFASNVVQSKNMFSQLTPAPFIISLTSPSSPISSCLSIFVLWSMNWKKKVQKKMQRHKQ